YKNWLPGSKKRIIPQLRDLRIYLKRIKYCSFISSIEEIVKFAEILLVVKCWLLKDAGLLKK
ncbi:MAG: hypothetical protein K8R25_08245, partial [Methanosarcinales archaeon]|nr:hypothetical protein [Methanosarcinales archaeon]